MNKFKKTCDDDLEQKILVANQKSELIARKLIQVYGKFEEYLNATNGGGVFKADHDQLNSTYKETI